VRRGGAIPEGGACSFLVLEEPGIEDEDEHEDESEPPGSRFWEDVARWILDFGCKGNNEAYLVR
jgi:hypothetical protein